jgi:ATP-binding cassette subfamily B protein
MNRTLLMSQLFAQIQELITLLSLTGALVIFNPWLILILIIGVIPSFIGETKFNSRSYALVTNFTPERRELDYLRLTASSDETAKEIKLSGISSFLIKRFKDLSEKYFNENKVLAIQKATWGTLLSIAGTIGYYGAYGWIALSAISGLISIGSLTFLAGSFARMRQIMEGILKRFADIAQGALYLEDYYSFFEIQPRIQDGNTWTPFPKPIKFGITLENVSFKYRGSEHFVLRNINLHIKPGERIAFVGENGSGKTTLVKLISRLYEPTEGQILLDGIPLNTYNPKELHENIGVIFQDYVRYQFTAGLNIAAGDIAFYDDFSRIKASAKNSLADQVIENLPEQYNQMIGRRFKNGIDLSGGQWQKIALGRVYMKDAQIVILDEPTASLDANAEHEVFERFSELSKGKIAFIISHRFSTVRMADRIAVIKNGEIIELGTHKQLIENQSLYYSLFTLQAKGYAD